MPLVVMISYNDCSRVGTPTILVSDSSGLASYSLSSACTVDLMNNTYSRTWHPFLQTWCNSCHANSHGSTDLRISFQAFMSKGQSLITYQATHAHGGNSFSSSMQTYIDAFLPQWNTGLNNQNTCLASTSDEDPSNSSQYFRTSAKSFTGLNTTNYMTMTYDLETDVADPSQKLPILFTIRVKYLTYSNVVNGFLFRDPMIQLKRSGVSPVQMGDIHLYLDDIHQEYVTDYTSTLAVAGSTAQTALALNYGAEPAYYPDIGPSTRVAFEFRKVKNPYDSSGATTDNSGGTSPPPMTTTPTVTLPATVTFTQLISNDATLGVFRNYCIGCHGTSGGLDLSNYTAARGRAALILSRMSSTSAPMPPTGRLSDQPYAEVVRRWINAGTPQ